MRANVVGRVRNTDLPKSKALLPVFEAVINSIDAIEDSGTDLSNSRIDIYIKRQLTLPLPDSGESEHRSHSPICGFEIHDTGVGFTEKNFQAFNEADTQIKADRGGKGVGRFLWLKAFRKVEIDSTFIHDGKIAQRTFEFTLEVPDGIGGHSLSYDSDLDHPRTIVRLIEFKEEYETHLPRAAVTIAQRLIEHCLEYYVLGNMPPVILHDEEEEEPILLSQLYENLVANTKRGTIHIDDHGFDVIHFFLHASSGLVHHISYCANSRVVLTDRISTKVANLPPVITQEETNEAYVYAGYVSSDYLDSRVNQYRTGFDIMPEGSDLFPSELPWPKIEAGILSASTEVLRPFTEVLRVEKEKRIRNYVNNSAPEYKYIVKKHPHQLDRIPPEASEEKVDRCLYDIHRQIESDLRRQANDFLDENLLAQEGVPSEEQLQRFSQFWEEWNEVGKASLAKYIVHRKYMLSFLEQALKRQESGKYSREEVVHQIIFPMKTTSDDLTFDKHNLWIIDEKLAYHRYLASDLRLSRVQEIDSDSSLRPDLLIFFDSAIAVVEEESPYSSGVVIFEFKKPMRDDYSEDNNPIQQVLRYVQEIKQGKARDKDGRPFRVAESTPFYCYIIADLTPHLQEQATYHNLLQTPDGAGYFGYNQGTGAYVEILDFDKLLQDSKKRNRTLFEKLNLPERLL